MIMMGIMMMKARRRGLAQARRVIVCRLGLEIEEHPWIRMGCSAFWVGYDLSSFWRY